MLPKKRTFATVRRIGNKSYYQYDCIHDPNAFFSGIMPDVLFDRELPNKTRLKITIEIVKEGRIE